MSFVNAEDLQSRLIKTAKSMLLCSLELEEFVDLQMKCMQMRTASTTEICDKEQVHSAKYWDAIVARVAFITEKVITWKMEVASCFVSIT